MAKSKTQPKQKSRSYAILLVVLIVLSAAIAGLLFQDFREVPYGWFISVVWLAVAAFSCAFGILYYAQFVLPHHEDENWLEGIAMMLRASTHLGSSEAAAQQSIRAKAVTTPRYGALSPSFRSLGAGMVPSHQALSIAKGGGFSRAAGPGFVRLQQGERPTAAIDLRSHVRSETATANSRDGIPLEVKVSVVFQVKQSPQDHAGDHLEFPYDNAAVFWVSQLNTFDQENSARPWSEQLAPQATAFMISEIAQYTLDELWQDPAIFNGIQQRIRRQLRGVFDEWGVKVHSVRVAPVGLPEQIAAQRMANWRAPWQSQILAKAAAGDAEALRRVKMARARAQVEIIEKTMQSIEEMRLAEEGSLPEIVTLRVIDVLEDAASRSSLQGYLPSQVLASMVQELPFDTESDSTAADVGSEDDDGLE